MFLKQKKMTEQVAPEIMKTQLDLGIFLKATSAEPPRWQNYT